MGVADRCHMTWEPRPRRWRKVYKGKTYTISCSELGVPETKEGSYQAANAWWDVRKSAIDAAQAPHPFARVIGGMRTRRDWLARHGQQDDVKMFDAEIRRVERLDGDAEFPFPVDFTPDGMARLKVLAGNTEVWDDRLSRDRTAPPEKALESLSTRFLALSAGRVAAGELSASEHDLACRCVGHFVDWIGGGNDPSVIDADRWEAYFLHLRGMVTAGTRGKEYCKKDWRYAKVFIEWMASMDKMAAPRNLHSRRYRFGETRAAIETFRVDEVRRLVDGATGQLKLHLLLMLNCGLYQSDISDLRKDEVDWDRGVITRQRSKTRHHGDKVPTVSYRLWPCTLALLRQHRSQDPVLALTTRDGKPWVAENVQDNRVKSRRDGIKSNYAHLVKRFKIEKPLKSFRKTSSSMLDGHTEFSRYAQFFLGHSGRSVAEKHYVRPNQEQFDRAVDWLRQQYGF